MMILLAEASVSQHCTRTSRGVLCSTSSNSQYTRTEEADLPKQDIEQAPYTLALSIPQSETQLEGPSHGVRTELCHICDQYIPFRDMSTHIKQHSMQRTSRYRRAICSSCERTIGGAETAGELPLPNSKNSGLCYQCSTSKKRVSTPSKHIDYHQEIKSCKEIGTTKPPSRKVRPLPLLGEHDYGRYLQYKRRSRKDRDKEGNEVWPDFVEEAFQAGEPKGVYWLFKILN